VKETNIEKFATFAQRFATDPPPPDVVDATKRIILDAIGCGLAATSSEFGRVGVEYGRILGANGDEATIIGHTKRTSIHGAAFANTELIAALDLTPITLPGHVAPFIVSLVLALGEAQRRSGIRVLSAMAVCLEMCFRLSKSMDDLRDVIDGKPATPRVFGYASMIFGLTAAASIVKGLQQATTADALGIAGSTSPVNALRTWQMHFPNTTIKYGLGPGIVLAAITAAYLAELGHRGSRQILDSAEFGYPSLVGSKTWNASRLTEALGDDWRFPAAISFKPYTTSRSLHATLDAVIQVVTENNIKVSEIEQIVAYGEAWAAEVPVYMNRAIEKACDAQMSYVHGISVAAHRIRPGKDWQRPDIVFNESVLSLMSRTEWRPHPGWGNAVSTNPLARPARAEVKARGQTFVAERYYPKGSPSPDPSTYATTDELLAKFRYNAEGVLTAEVTEKLAAAVLNLESVADINTVSELLRP
jgi:2-methylcitrate dehydratase PrpD